MGTVYHFGRNGSSGISLDRSSWEEKNGIVFTPISHSLTEWQGVKVQILLLLKALRIAVIQVLRKYFKAPSGRGKVLPMIMLASNLHKREMLNICLIYGGGGPKWPK